MSSIWNSLCEILRQPKPQVTHLHMLSADHQLILCDSAAGRKEKSGWPLAQSGRVFPPPSTLHHTRSHSTHSLTKTTFRSDHLNIKHLSVTSCHLRIFLTKSDFSRRTCFLCVPFRVLYPRTKIKFNKLTHPPLPLIQDISYLFWTMLGQLNSKSMKLPSKVTRSVIRKEIWLLVLTDHLQKLSVGQKLWVEFPEIGVGLLVLARQL